MSPSPNRQAPCQSGTMKSVQSVAKNVANTSVFGCGFRGFRGETSKAKTERENFIFAVFDFQLATFV
jgi:hypothetical protein